MPAQLNDNIWDIVVDILSASFLSHDTTRSRQGQTSLLALRLTSRALAIAVTPILFSSIQIRELTTVNFERLGSLLQSPLIPQAVKKYELDPHIITSRQGEQSSSYHKIPPHLDYGRNSASSVIRDENKKLRQAAAQWEAQNRIIYPSQRKATAFIKKTFQWSGSGGKPGLKDSIYFTALDAFVNLTTLIVGFPPPGPSILRQDVARDFNMALGRYLARNPAHLTTIRVRSLTPYDLTTLVRSIAENPRRVANLSLSTTTLEIFLMPAASAFESSLHSYEGMTTSLTTLLQYTPKLVDLRILYGSESWNERLSQLEHLLVSPFSPPTLQNLERLTLGGLAFAAADLLALAASSPSRLTVLILDSISLTSSTWAQVLRSFAESENLENLAQPSRVTGISYFSLPKQTLTKPLPEDHKAASLWQANINERLA